ncbi:phosphodiester glycosidase family protein [uncultured Enterococcus sp.]|uniref:phosphodiester glycosidase family protein n=1 Tax=uncultured Enterococcus sp. TaxID=167972 RepID=UPI0025F8CDBD|nr:phosphodiester glycosidase family protein [uncultured Enterococcus sp.]
MKKFFKRPFRWAIVYSIFLLASTSFILLKAFVLPDRQIVATTTQTTQTTTTTTDTSTTESEEVVQTDTSYSGNGLTISLTEQRIDDTTVYLVDVQTDDPSHLLTALADNSYGRNIKETTSTIAKANDAVLAINGDFYGFRSTGFVVRNGTLYRDSANGDTDALVIDKNGDFSIVNEATTDANTLDAQQVLSFGPALVESGSIVVDENSEVGQSAASNPRTAIGQIGTNHYLIVVSEGRTDDSQGLSLYQLAQVMQDNGVQTGYNLDGGGSTTLYFNGKVVNQTVGGSGQSSERAVSDIVYFK